MRKYETMFILKPTLNEEEIKAKVELIKSTLEGQGAEVVAIDEMGSRPLAYRIDKYERGYYVVIYFTGNGQENTELERVYRINEDIIRHIVVKYERKVEVAAWENMVKKAKGEPHKEIGFVERKPRKPREPREDRAPRREYNKEEKKSEEVSDAK
ncbi:MAG: 30S ribosomal protein S6 [Campylobacterales bacterium]|nr:30S ribosomal protein S6 [Campylobacterales bacterium]